uniref:ISLre2 family transposase n=1 Tax=Alicyclobacillus mali (ex Roth et al. 2021) TaxID=1123961 RepID=UPI000B1D2979
REKVFEQGEVPSGTSKVETLFVEADGVYVRGRRAEDGQSHFELKVAVAYEGKQEQGRERRALMNRQVVVGTEEAERFWEGAVASFGRVWDWASVKRCWVGADGAEWAKKGVEMLPGARYRLDPFHLRRAIAGALGRETQAYRKVWDAVGSGDWSQVEKVLRKAESQSEGAKKQRISKLKSYMEKNWEGIVSDGDVVSLGTIEGQVFHHVARRMKRHGARWSKSGADALVRLVAARSNQEPLRVRRLSRFEVQPNELANGKRVNEAELTRHAKEAVRWLERQMPALVGPHADRPWVKYVLRELSRISFTVA